MPGFGGGLETAITAAAHRNKPHGARVRDRISQLDVRPQRRTHGDGCGLGAVGLFVQRNPTRK